MLLPISFIKYVTVITEIYRLLLHKFYLGVSAKYLPAVILCTFFAMKMLSAKRVCE